MNSCYIISQTYCINYEIKQKLVNLNSQIEKFIVKITKSKYLSKDAKDGLQLNHYHCIKIHQPVAQFGDTPSEIGN